MNENTKASKKTWTFLTAGFAMFSMFFGSGNLVFPLLVGFGTLDQCLGAAGGLLLTGTLVPFLGLLALIVTGGDRTAFFGALGRWPSFFVTFLILSLLGPFGVCARCVLVSHGSVLSLFPDLILPVFSGIFCFLAAIMTLNRQRIVRLIGRYLTPFLLFGILLILVVGNYRAPVVQSSALSSLKAFNVGLHQGYQMMDLLAAFFFSATIVDYLKSHVGKKASSKTIATEAVKASLVGVFLLGLVYIGFVSLGAAYSPFLDGHHPENMLVLIAEKTLGPMALPIIVLTIIMACLTTLIVLASLFADFLQKDVCQEKISRPTSVIVTYAICFGTSLIGFEALVSVIGEVLEVLYPALIIFSVMMIVDSCFKTRFSAKAFYTALVVSGGLYFAL